MCSIQEIRVSYKSQILVNSSVIIPFASQRYITLDIDEAIEVSLRLQRPDSSKFLCFYYYNVC